MALYKQLLQANSAWVIHFTVEDEYCEHPHWQSDAYLNQGINLVHFWQDRDFSNLRMSARWKDTHGNVQQIDNEQLNNL